VGGGGELDGGVDDERVWKCIAVVTLCSPLAPLVGGRAPAISQRYYPAAKKRRAQTREEARKRRTNKW